jgi:mRNA interferase MazF
MVQPLRGEIWLVDLGLAAKVRPALVLNIPFEDCDRALVTIVPHTTAIRGSRFEVALEVPVLKSGAFDVQQVLLIPTAKLIRRLGSLTSAQFQHLESALRRWLGIS